MSQQGNTTPSLSEAGSRPGSPPQTPKPSEERQSSDDEPHEGDDDDDDDDFIPPKTPIQVAMGSIHNASCYGPESPEPTAACEHTDDLIRRFRTPGARILFDRGGEYVVVVDEPSWVASGKSKEYTIEGLDDLMVDSEVEGPITLTVNGKQITLGPGSEPSTCDIPETDYGDQERQELMWDMVTLGRPDKT